MTPEQLELAKAMAILQVHSETPAPDYYRALALKPAQSAALLKRLHALESAVAAHRFAADVGELA
jgi:hypothetical protein